MEHLRHLCQKTVSFNSLAKRRQRPLDRCLGMLRISLGHANFSRNQLRKNQTLERFHEFLTLANEIGNITRQEAVSKVPPLFLDVHPENFVLDNMKQKCSCEFHMFWSYHSPCQGR